MRIACARSHPLPGTTPPLAAHQWEPVSCWWGTGRLGELGGGAGEPRTAPPRRRGANQHLGGHQPKLGSVLLETLGPRFIQPQGSARRPTFPLQLQVNCLRRYSQINYRVIYRSAPATPRSFAQQRMGAVSSPASRMGAGDPGPHGVAVTPSPSPSRRVAHEAAGGGRGPTAPQRVNFYFQQRQHLPRGRGGGTGGRWGRLGGGRPRGEGARPRGARGRRARARAHGALREETSR